MKNFNQNAETLPLIAPYAVTSGQGLLVGSMFGVAVDAAALGAQVETLFEGAVSLTKAVGAIGQGALVYWDNAARNVTTTAAGNKLIGVTLGGAQSGDATVIVRLNGAFIS
jgi:predicted RecA/RadA family phage recombinase